MRCAPPSFLAHSFALALACARRSARVFGGSADGDTELLRESRREDLVSGTVVAAVEGSNAGAPARSDIGKWAFSFKYFSSIEQQVTLPAGLQPERVTIEVRTNGASVAPYRKTFVWNPVS